MNNTANNYWGQTIIIADTLETLHYTIHAIDTSYNHNNTIIKNVTIHDNDKPEISNINDNPDPQGNGKHLNISCTATDNIQIDTVKINITNPENNTINTTMTNNGDQYYYNTTYTTIGTYHYSIWAIDTSGNSITSPFEQFLSLIHI